MDTSTTYDYIIAGGGLAGLTLAWQISKSPLLRDKRVLLIDREAKNTNDRTWSFWLRSDTPWLQELPLHHSWSHAEIPLRQQTLQFELAPYRYYTIEGLSFYRFIAEELAKSKQIERLQADIFTVLPHAQRVVTSQGDYHFKSYCFKGYFEAQALQEVAQQQGPFMWQHFLGWKIRVPKPLWNPHTFTYMDLRVPQKDPGLTFCYLLPEKENVALVEYTLFSAVLWEKERYEAALRDYIKTYLGDTPYEILEVEHNKIPMTTARLHPKAGKGPVIPIGTLAGTVKPSTGFSFVRNFQHVQKIIKKLETGAGSFEHPGSGRYKLFDAVLMNVMLTEKEAGVDVFEQLYRKNSMQRLFRFLDEESALWEDILIMNSVPRKWPFVQAVLEEL